MKQKLLVKINVGIGAYFVYYKYMNGDKATASRYDYVYQTKISLTNKLIKWEKSNK